MILKDQLYTKQQVLKIFSLKCDSVLKKLVENGEIKPLVFGNKYRYRGKDILDFMDYKQLKSYEERSKMFRAKFESFGNSANSATKREA